MKRKVLLVLGLMVVILALAACGKKTQEDVVKDLNGKMEELKGYKATAKMTLQMGAEPQVYDVEVWHNQPDYYRVQLKNEGKNQSQLILRNKDGVFVVTPALNKSYKFQSEWPKNSSQAYLYESLVKDIVQDKDAKFKQSGNNYVFETKTRYQNSNMLPYQEIVFDKKTLAPKSVKVMDNDHNALLSVNFKKVTFDTKFDKNAFDTKKNMTSAKLDVPVSGQEKAGLTVLYPTAEIGAKLLDENEVKTANGKRVILTYGGSKPFTLVEEVNPAVTATADAVTPVSGEVVNLGFTIGALGKDSITWSKNGVDYLLASKHLTKEEMIELAQSVQGEPAK